MVSGIKQKNILWLFLNINQYYKVSLSHFIIQNCPSNRWKSQKRLKKNLQIGQKRPAPTQAKDVMEARSLMGRFRSKKDLYDYLLFHRQQYMPPRRKVTKDFLKEVFAGKRSLIAQEQIRPINVPKYDELSVKGLIKDVMANEQLASSSPNSVGPPISLRGSSFITVINTVEPDYLAALIRHSQNLRFNNTNPDENDNAIVVNKFWQREQQASPFFSKSPDKTLQLLKKASKRCRSGFKRKKLPVLGTFSEIKNGAKRLEPSAPAFASNPDAVVRMQQLKDSREDSMSACLSVTNYQILISNVFLIISSLSLRVT